MSPSSTSAPSPEPPQSTLPVGTAVWRRRGKARRGGEDVAVLLVRDKGDDAWRFPASEVTEVSGRPTAVGGPATAVRATREQTGVPVLAGVPLADGFWAAQPRADKSTPKSGPGIAEASWVGIADAAARLGAGRDRAVLEALAGAAEAGRLHTRPVLVVRHARARPRDSWSDADAERPLISRGRREAAALVDLLQCWRPEYVLSSPWLRCRQTLSPYAERTGVKVRTKGGLSEAGHERSPEKAVRHLQSLLDRDGSGLLCTHRPVLGSLVAALAEFAPDDATVVLPDADPWLSPAEALVAHVRSATPGERTPRGRTVRVEAFERHRPLHD